MAEATKGPYFVKRVEDSDQSPDLYIDAAYSPAEAQQFPESAGKWIATVRRYHNEAEQRATAALLAAAPELRDALEALTTHPHVSLGDLVYAVREREGEGWEGPAVKAWSDAVKAAAAALAKARGGT